MAFPIPRSFNAGSTFDSPSDANSLVALDVLPRCGASGGAVGMEQAQSAGLRTSGVCVSDDREVCSMS